MVSPGSGWPRRDGSGATFIAPVEGTNGPVPGAGNAISWSPDSKQIAFVSSTPGPETADADGDPHVFTRYLYKPSAGEGVHPFQDNRRLHVFLADLASKQVRQLTSGDRYEHSVEWAPSGDRILFESNMEENPDPNFNYDILTVGVSDGAIHQLTHQVGPKYGAVWSPDGSKIAYTHTVRPDHLDGNDGRGRPPLHHERRRIGRAPGNAVNPISVTGRRSGRRTVRSSISPYRTTAR